MKAQTQSLKNDIKGKGGGMENNERCKEEQLVGRRTTPSATVK